MIKYLLQKEFLQIRRNSFMPKIIFIFPIMVMCVMPWVMNQEVKNIRVDVVDIDHTSHSQQLVHQIEASNYFIFNGQKATYQEAMKDIETSKADIILEIRDGKYLIAANAVNGTKGSIGSSYLSQIVSTNLTPPSSLLTPQEIIISRTGYTGEDGFEIYASHEYINDCWDKLIAAGVQACGLGCRDTLRFEVGLPLYGDELSEDITPIMAGLGMFVKLDKAEFIGKEALAKQKVEGPARKLVGIELADKAIPRHGYEVLNMEGEPIGEVTTGYRTLSTDKSVCMALIDAQYAKLDTEVQIQIRKKVFPGKVVKKQFYNKSYKK